VSPHDQRILVDAQATDAAVVREGNEREFTDETVVEFEGKRVTWGSLMVQDRKAYMQCGFYPF
jgi:hypothetical protein